MNATEAEGSGETLIAVCLLPDVGHWPERLALGSST